MYDWFLRCHIYFVQGLFDFFPHCQGWTDWQPVLKQTICYRWDSETVTCNVLVWGGHETTPRLAKREALSGGISYTGSAFPSAFPLHCPLHSGKAGIWVCQWQSFCALTSKRLKVRLSEMKNQSGVTYKWLLLMKACVLWK